MSEQDQLNKTEQSLENTTLGDDKMVDLVSARQEIQEHARQETDEKEPRQESSNMSDLGQLSEKEQPLENTTPAEGKMMGLESTCQERLEPRGQQKEQPLAITTPGEDKMVDLVSSRQDRPEATGQQSAYEKVSREESFNMSDLSQLNEKEQPIENTTPKEGKMVDFESICQETLEPRGQQNEQPLEKTTPEEGKMVDLESTCQERLEPRGQLSADQEQQKEESFNISDQDQLNKKSQPLESTSPREGKVMSTQKESLKLALKESMELPQLEGPEASGQQSKANQKEPKKESLSMPDQDPLNKKERPFASKTPRENREMDLEPSMQGNQHPAWKEGLKARGHRSRTDFKELKKDPMPSWEGPKPQPYKQKTIITILGFAVLIAIAFALYFFWPHETQTSDFRPALEIFQDKFKSLQKDFPEQSQYLWLRSEKMLRNHLNKSQHFEPATLILTAAQDARHTLLCLGSGLAQSYAAALNASWLVIHGPSESKYDDSTAKLHIDEKLSSAFQSDCRAAVLSHLEALPPGSLLILYKYCDHENAAYKNVALVFTVLLEDSSLEPDISLPELEEKVRDFLWQQFITSSTIRSHMEMDSDKLGGVWSRISHLVLPVLPVESMERGSCPFDHGRN